MGKGLYCIPIILLFMFATAFFIEHKTNDNMYSLVSERLGVSEKQLVINQNERGETYTVTVGEKKYKVEFDLFYTKIKHFAEERS
ncbi:MULTISPECIES: hypothetical protein [Bacillus]|uniref:hypothetical protein n=1 Tax=Bacillus TaxID=1386 RepID=UPI00077979DE|nr:hypothetical protein [Bacillus amyloliquefaciens]MBW8281923.1 hypothetical protein [Bacillus amyloliquefaciens]MEC1248299.1 hypothetical protein [Bacillus amyloliquefaciens]MEC2251983.1 hypothetical protein [Bacillus amyloliquefaciens]MED0755441.1 hypothetical protein [Bacillus amyloliquefaciens]MED0831136.1 hypothetical protein [Bacillus amyloliquefaciens]